MPLPPPESGGVVNVIYNSVSPEEVVPPVISGGVSDVQYDVGGAINPIAILSAVSGTGTFAGTGTLSATLTSSGVPVPGEVTVTFTLTSGTTTTTVGSATTDSNGVATLPDVSLTGFGAGTYTGAVGASFASDATHTGSGAGGELTVNRATPGRHLEQSRRHRLTGTPLGLAQLDAAASVAGTFAYTPAAGTFLNAGQGQTLSAAASRRTIRPTSTRSRSPPRSTSHRLRCRRSTSRCPMEADQEEPAHDSQRRSW